MSLDSQHREKGKRGRREMSKKGVGGVGQEKKKKNEQKWGGLRFWVGLPTWVGWRKGKRGKECNY